MVGWDEILHPDLPNLTSSTRGRPKGLAAAAKAGYATILSNGYYIDLAYPTWQHYLNDPLPATLRSRRTNKACAGRRGHDVGRVGHAETIDSRIWPRTAAIAERLWSPRDVRDLDEMYRRLAIVSSDWKSWAST